jgi:hypothetical protein
MDLARHEIKDRVLGSDLAAHPVGDAGMTAHRQVRYLALGAGVQSTTVPRPWVQDFRRVVAGNSWLGWVSGPAGCVGFAGSGLRSRSGRLGGDRCLWPDELDRRDEVFRAAGWANGTPPMTSAAMSPVGRSSSAAGRGPSLRLHPLRRITARADVAAAIAERCLSTWPACQASGACLGSHWTGPVGCLPGGEGLVSAVLSRRARADAA